MKSHFRRVAVWTTIASMLLAPSIYASSQQAYQDYLFQADTYRAAVNEYTIARTEFLKFRSLASETIALEKGKQLLLNRNRMVDAYLKLLVEKLNENTGLNQTERAQYIEAVQNELPFLFTNSQFVQSSANLTDAQKVSQQFVTRYQNMSSLMRQIAIVLSLGELASAARNYEKYITGFQTLIASNRHVFSTGKQTTLDRWLLQIKDKKTVYEQKAATAQSLLGTIKGDANEQIRVYNQLTKSIEDARQHLADGSSFMVELATALRYAD